MIRRPPRSTLDRSSAASDVYKRQHIYPGFFAVVDVTNKANPLLLATQTTPTAFTHNTWLSDDHKTLFTTDENNYSFLGAFDISDLSNICLLYTSDAADERSSVDLGGRRIIKNKKKRKKKQKKNKKKNRERDR